MSDPQMRKRARHGGFTLIELLVVVLIIGILAAIAIPAYLSQKHKAQDSAAMSLVRSGVIAAESYGTDPDNQGFTGMVPELLTGHEQNVAWVTGTARTIDNQVGVATLPTGAAKQTSYVLSSTSQSGTTYAYYRRTTGAAVKCRGTGDPVEWAEDNPTSCGGTFAQGW